VVAGGLVGLGLALAARQVLREAFHAKTTDGSEADNRSAVKKHRVDQWSIKIKKS
jgi:hypothetical protein